MTNLSSRKGHNLAKPKKRVAVGSSKEIAKKKRNYGQKYITVNNKVVNEKAIQPPCKDECKHKCSHLIDQATRENIFKNYWLLGDFQQQRDFIHNSMENINPLYRYPKSTGSNKRNLNQAFYFSVNNINIRICKTFFKNTLSINDRTIRTVLSKLKDGFVEKDKRGKHLNHKKLDLSIKDGVRAHINSIPRIESHYLRSQTTREFIDGGKSLADIHRDYVNVCKQNNLPFAKIDMCSRIFNREFNISFFYS